MTKYLVIGLGVLGLLFSCNTKQVSLEESDDLSEKMLPALNRQLTNVIIADIFTPPVASRIYAYSNIAAYEVMQHFDSGFVSLQGQLNGFNEISLTGNENVYPPLGAVVAHTKTAAALVYSTEKVEEIQRLWVQKYKNAGLNDEMIDHSVRLGEEVAAHIIEWAKKDGYNKRTGLGGYQVSDNDSTWKPTAPDFMEAIEPHWKTLRTFVLDSASQFNPGGPINFSTAKESEFYESALEIYDQVNEKSEEKLSIAQFWDCNPNISYTQGHVMMYRQQNSPGGHWIHITGQVVEKEALSIMEQAEAFAIVSLTLGDAFISCWEEKYNSNLIRPQTYINSYIDSTWFPALQTPAFPEHTSGHSVASASAATVLTNLFGDNYVFVDSTELPFGLPSRNFKSFYHASDEAAISRFYGGIHYMPAIEKGVDQGKNVGNHVLNKISTRL